MNLRINEAIRVPKVRLISETGQQIGIVSTKEALARAFAAGLDLVEVAPKEKPPVCKIMDYGKWKYQQQKKLHQSKKKQHIGELKELRVRPKTDKHDLEIKLNKARQFIEQGHKVQFTMIFRGRERQHADLGKQIFSDIANHLSDIAKQEKDARFEGRRMFVVFAPIKKALTSKSHQSEKSSAQSQQEIEQPKNETEAITPELAETENKNEQQ